MQLSFLDSKDGTRLRVGVTGDGPRALLLVHGFAEHLGRQERLSSFLAARGWTVTAVELRGHGHSGGRRAFVGAWSDYADDVAAVAATLPAGWCLYGHSMGGLVCLDGVRSGLLQPAKLALSNPLLGLHFRPPLYKSLPARLLSRVWPTLEMGNEIDPNGLSRDPEIGRAYVADPLVFSTVTPRWFVEMQKAQQRVTGHAFTTPAKMFIGAADPITDPALNESFARKNGMGLQIYPEMRHEIVNEIGKEQVMADIAAFLE